MRIKELIIDGFKSYANRTVISGFDRSFNAITGRNGTGKSNILDAICFVLGISKLSQVRVDKLSELVYKNGQAGITKASVTIVFDNSDVATSPVGYEHCKEIAVTRQVVVGGRNKHLINGRTARSNQVHNLFHSVQLDVNNPHFLIMQGRIVKMMNMKPLEVLGLIEEAGGTRMFERKKQASLKIIEKKERKEEEIDKIIAEEISPTLIKLQKDRAEYRQYTENQMRIERAKRQCVAHEYWKKKKVQNASSSTYEGLKSKLETIGQQEEELVSQQGKNKEEQAALVAQKEGEFESKLKVLQDAEDKSSKRLVKANSMWQNKKASLTTDCEAHTALEAQAAAAIKSGQKVEKQLEKHSEKCAAAQKKLGSVAQELQAQQQQLQALSAGMASGDGQQEQSLAQQLLEARGEAKAAAATVKQLKMTSSHRTKEHKSTTKQLKAEKKNHSTLLRQLEQAESEVARLEKKVGALRYEEGEEHTCAAQVGQQEQDLLALDDRIERLSAKLSQFVRFTYRDPSRGFDRSKVKGLVGRLLKVKDVAMTTAIEVAAGGRLYQLVVDTESTGKQLLKHGQLKQRVTIIPLNKIRARVAPIEKVRAAAQVVAAGGKGGGVRLALELVGYADEVKQAMQYVFGNTLVCDDMSSARAVTFNKKIRMKSVTKEGDSLDPSGVMSGGSSTKRHVLASLRELDDLTARRDAAREALRPLQRRLQTMRDVGSQHRALAGELELKAHELSLVRDRCSGSRFSTLQEKCNQLEEALAKVEADMVLARTRHTAQQERATGLEAQIKDFEKSRKQQLSEKEKSIAKLKRTLAGVEAKAQQAQQARELCVLELEQMRADATGVEAQLTASTAAMAKLEAAIEELAAQVAAERDEYTKAKGLLDGQRDKLSKCDDQLRALDKQRSRMASRHASLMAAKKKMQHKIRRFEEEQRAATDTVTSLREQYAWIAAEEQFFGQRGSDYDFAANGIKEVSRQLIVLEKEQAGLSQRINHKVMGMIEKAETDYAELKQKREIIRRDKQKIMATIAELMVRKNKAVWETYAKVNKDFGSMFSTFLPGTQAELKPVDGDDILKGLLPRVAFGGKWKESLMELSGGQRSLLALSLVLAMLLFKPAPMYILDEVDAALDVCHTQNIGKLLRSHFKQSQFIIVSLKEGMFDNANVVFTTKNVDGISGVNRTVRNRQSRPAGPEQENKDRPAAAGKKTKRTKQSRKPRRTAALASRN